MNNCSSILALGVEELNLPISQDALDRLLIYVDLLVQWNKAYSLTSINDPRMIIKTHVLDSLAILPYIKGERMADVGSGAGLPGIPLAVACPEQRFTLIDSQGKKTRFLFHVVSQLRLKNVEVIQERVEMFFPRDGFNGVVTRAFGSLSDIIAAVWHLLCPHGTLYAMKGKLLKDELAMVDKIMQVYRLSVPGLHARRHLICLQDMPDE